MTTPGTRWVARKGRHSGTEVEILKLTSGGQVVIRYVGGGGASWSNAKSEAAGVQTLGRDVFLATYVPREQLAEGEGRHAGRPFRQNNRARQASMDSAIGAAIVDRPNGSVYQARDNVATSSLHIEVMTITPDMARGWLDRGGANRKLSERRVQRLMMAILRGEWQLTGEAIKLDADSKVRDGQHRLEAIFRAGIPVQSVIIRNVTEDAFDVMDTGAARNPADVLGIHGLPSRMGLASAARGLILIERFGRYQPTRWDPETTVTSKETLAYVQAHPELVDLLHMASRLRKEGFIGGEGVWTTALALLWRTDNDALNLFLESLVSGANLPSNSSVLKLRNMFKANYAKWDSSGKGREAIIALVIKAWNHWRKAEAVQQLHWRSEGRSAEPFPVPE